MVIIRSKKKLNEPGVFLAQVDFPRHRRGAKGLSHFRWLRNSPSEPFHVRIPENAQAALAKISIRSKNRQFHFYIYIADYL